MRLGVDFPQEWKLHSEKAGIALSDILYGYIIESLMIRISKSSFYEYLWLTSEDALGEEAYKKKVKDRLSFLYMESGRKVLQEEPHAGHPLSQGVAELFAKEVLDAPLDEVLWSYDIEEKDAGFAFGIEGYYMGMKVPVALHMENVPENVQTPKRKEMELLYAGKKPCPYLSYSKESVLAESLFEIVRKLELIGDMESYCMANEILKNQSISGRHIIEDFKVLGEKEPKVISMKRLQQIETYKTYAYMRKKWEQYEKRHGRTPEEWSEVVDRILAFLGPMWKALCDNEIFFDDWMPELGRFLG